MNYNTYPTAENALTYQQWLDQQGGVEYRDYDPSAGVSLTAEGERKKVRDPAQFAVGACLEL